MAIHTSEHEAIDKLLHVKFLNNTLSLVRYFIKKLWVGWGV